MYQEKSDKEQREPEKYLRELLRLNDRPKRVHATIHEEVPEFDQSRTLRIEVDKVAVRSHGCNSAELQLLLVDAAWYIHCIDGASAV